MCKLHEVRFLKNGEHEGKIHDLVGIQQKSTNYSGSPNELSFEKERKNQHIREDGQKRAKSGWYHSRKQMNSFEHHFFFLCEGHWFYLGELGKHW